MSVARRRRPAAGRLGRGAGGVLGLAALLVVCACAAAPPRETGGPEAVPVPPRPEQPARPALTMPPAPTRTEREAWAEAERRGSGLAAEVKRDLAALQPGAIPAEARAPEPARPAPAPKPEGRPSAPPTAAPAAPATPPPAAPAGRSAAAPRTSAAVPAVRVIQTYTTENGLPSNRVTALYVDDQDAWVGTADAGVARLNFAEGNWIVTKVEDGLASNRVTDIIKYEGLILVGTQEGISIWDGVAWTTRTEVDKVKLLNAAFRIHDGLLWVAARTMFGGLLSFDGERWRDQSTMKPGTVLNNISDFQFSGKLLWIGTTNRGLYRFDGREWQTITVADGIASNFVYTLAVKGDGCYLGGCCGVSAYEGGAWRIYDVAEGLPHSTVNAIAVDGDLVWFGSKKGLGLFDGFQFTNFYADSGLSDDRISSLYVKGAEVWVGTANGLNRLEKSY